MENSAKVKKAGNHFFRLFNKIYDESRLEEFTIPYSTTNIERLNVILGLYSNFFQGIVSFTHNNFEIRILLEKFPGSGRLISETLRNSDIEKLFVQFIALFEMAKKLHLDFIDFNRFYVSKDFSVTFAVVLSKEINPDLRQILAIFQKHDRFKDLHERNYKDIFNDLSGRYKFNENQTYLYRYGDFTTNILDSYPLTRSGSSANIKIKIKTADINRDRIIKINLINSIVSEDVFLIYLDNEANNLPGSLAAILSEKSHREPKDFVKIINELKLFMKKSSFTSLLILIDDLKTRQDSEFIKYLLDSSGITNILLVVFEENDYIDFDLELKEKPPNLLEKFLRFYNVEEIKDLSRQEQYLLKVFKTVPGPLAKETLPDVFPDDERYIIKGLINKKYLKEDAGKISLNTNLPAGHIPVSKKEEKDILKLFLDKFDSLNIMIKYFIKTGRRENLKKILKKYLQNRYKFEDGYTSIRRICFENLDFIQQEVELIRLFADIFIKENDLHSARELIDCCVELDPVFLDLKLARIFALEKEYIEMDRILKKIAGEIPPALHDEFFYLKLIGSVKKTGFEKAEKYRKKIKSELYLNLADIILSDRYIYKGEYQKAGQLLEKTIAYLGEERFFRDELDAKNQLAKVLRGKNEYEKSEALYKNIFIQSEINNYNLLSGHIAIDIGNLYWIQDDSNQAESWYKKGLRIYRRLNNKNGEILAESNLAEISRIKGSWQETENYLKSILQYDKEKNKIDSLAIDYYNISYLEYLKHNYTKALEFINTAITLFEKKENLVNKIEAELLKLKILALKEGKKYGRESFREYNDILKGDQEILYSLLEGIEKKDRQKEAPLLIEKIGEITSLSNRFETLTFMIKKYRNPEMLEMLRSLSMALSRETRNYYYYEYFYIYFNYFFNGKEMNEEQREIFSGMYYFFLKNKRKISPGISQLKNLLDEKDSSYDIFKSAELVEDYRQWKIPEDFFKSLVNEINKVIKADLVKLVIYEQENQLFNFSYPNKYTKLTDELVSSAISRAENLNLDLEETRKLVKSEDKVLYFFKNSKVFLWKIAENLFGVILLAFAKADHKEYDFRERNKDLLKKFAALIQRYYETDYKLHRKLDFIIGESLIMKHVKKKILKIGKVDFTVLITGESGSGKELIARGIHLMSSRTNKPFIAVNAAAIPENLLEAELFGYKKGAFTGANENRPGLIEAADRGTLFLDEIADLPMNLQAKLLRAFQEQEIRRLGENTTKKVDFRLISATNKDLKVMAKNNRFREDLYYRLEVLQIAVPPLRDRVEDIPLLAEYFLKKNNFPIKDKLEFQSIVEYLKSREWHGNVRELESNIKRLITYYPDFEIGETVTYKTDFSLKAAKDNLEKFLVIKTLKENNWNKIKTSRALKISRMYLFNLIKKYDITKE